LVVLADKSVPNDTLVRLAELARQAGIQELLQATRPRLAPQPTTTSAAP
jgi:biopolymer transport protein ExbD